MVSTQAANQDNSLRKKIGAFSAEASFFLQTLLWRFLVFLCPFWALSLLDLAFEAVVMVERYRFVRRCAVVTEKWEEVSGPPTD
jgi:hypothetical protein